MAEHRTRRLNLASLHRECELNYARIMEFVANHDAVGSCFSANVRQQSIVFTVTEITKYTLTMSVAIQSMAPKWVPEIDLKVRIYHDAKMAEVIEWCSDRTIPWELVENKGLQSRDEKWQWNVFFSELLSQGISCRAMEAQSK